MTFDAEFDELAALAYQTAFRILGSRAEAEEVAQDTMVKAYLRWRRVQGHARPWVCRVAANGSLGIVRRRQRGRRHRRRMRLRKALFVPASTQSSPTSAPLSRTSR